MQHPLGHDAAAHVHLPPWHRIPTVQAGVVPQVQAPLAEHPSARTASQPTHMALPVPQVASAGLLQVDPEQHPVGQEVGLQLLQRPFVQVSPGMQVSQVPPPTPHELAESPSRQTPAEQQP